MGGCSRRPVLGLAVHLQQWKRGAKPCWQPCVITAIYLHVIQGGRQCQVPTWACRIALKLAMYEVSRCCGRAGAGTQGGL